MLLDGMDLRSVADSDLRREVILITQENFLFSASIAENIELGKPGATRAQIEAAAEAVGAASSSWPCRRDTTRRWASAVGGCRPGSAS